MATAAPDPGRRGTRRSRFSRPLLVVAICLAGGVGAAISLTTSGDAADSHAVLSVGVILSSPTVGDARDGGDVFVQNDSTTKAGDLFIDSGQIRATLSCGSLTHNHGSSPCTSPDPDIFAPSVTATGAIGTDCAGQTFRINPVNLGTGEVAFYGPRITLRHTDADNLNGGICVINFTFDVLRAPRVDEEHSTAALQTGQLVTASARSALPGLVTGRGTNVTTVDAGPTATTASAIGPAGPLDASTVAITGAPTESNPDFSVGVILSPPTVGDVGDAADVFVQNNAPTQDGSLQIASGQVRATLSCGSLAGNNGTQPCAAPDPGVFAPSTTATGAIGTDCAGAAFHIEPVAGSRSGQVEFVGPPITLSATDADSFNGGVCILNFSFDVPKVPSIDEDASTPGLQTGQLISASATDAQPGLMTGGSTNALTVDIGLSVPTSPAPVINTGGSGPGGTGSGGDGSGDGGGTSPYEPPGSPPGLGVGVVLESPTVGDTGDGGDVFLQNNETNQAGDLVIGGGQIRATLSCDAVAGNDGTQPCAAPDPGVFAPSATASGAIGTDCAGDTFAIDPVPGSTTGQFVLEGPQITLTGTDANNLNGGSCILDFTFNVLKAPVTAGQVTGQLASATATSALPGLITAGGTDTTSVSLASPDISGQASAGAPVGGTISDSATLSGGFEPTGTIDFSLFGPNDPTCDPSGEIDLAPVAVNGNGAYPSPGYTPTAPGTYLWTVTYAGDSNNGEVNDTCATPGERVVVVPAAPALAGQASPGVPVGGAITDSATLSGGFDPTGTITFSLFGPNDPTCAAAGQIPLAPVAVSGDGAYPSASFTPTAAGTYQWVASYSGDPDNKAAAGVCGAADQSVVVTSAPVTVTVAPATLPDGTVGVAYSQAITASGGTAPYAFAVTSGALPTGLVLSPAGALSGTPTAVGPFTFVITATDANGATGTQSYAVTIAAAGGSSERHGGRH